MRATRTAPLRLELTDVRRTDQSVLVIDFATLPAGDAMRHAVADRFAAMCSGDGTWNTRDTVERAFGYTKRFLSAVPLESPSSMRPQQWREWVLSLPPGSRSTVAAPVRSLLRGVDGVTEATRQALDTVPLRRPEPVAGVPSLSDAEVERIRVDAFDTLRAARDRINAGWDLVRALEAGAIAEGHPDYEHAQVLHEIATTGDIAQRYPSGPATRVVPVSVRLRLWGSRSMRSPMPLYEALYATADEVSAALVALVITCGWNVSVALDVGVNDLRRADARDGSEQTVLLVTLMKPRRGQSDTWTESYVDTGARSKARLILLIEEVTRGARSTLATVGHPTDALLVTLATGLNAMRQSPSGTPLFPLRSFDGRTIMTYLANWRAARPDVAALATPKVLRLYFTTVEHPQGHTPDVNHEYALRDANVRRDAQATIAEGIESAYSDVQARVLDEDRATVEQAPAAAAAGTLEDLNAGRLDTVAAACQNPASHPDTGDRCRASLLTCFACRNAVVLRRHLPRILALHERLDALRTIADEDAWVARFAGHFQRISDLVTPGRYFDEATIDRARSDLTDADRTAAARLLNHEWDVA